MGNLTDPQNTCIPPGFPPILPPNPRIFVVFFGGLGGFRELGAAPPARLGAASRRSRTRLAASRGRRWKDIPAHLSKGAPAGGRARGNNKQINNFLHRSRPGNVQHAGKRVGIRLAVEGVRRAPPLPGGPPARPARPGGGGGTAGSPIRLLEGKISFWGI